jgi:hypothetical protein
VRLCNGTKESTYHITKKKITKHDVMITVQVTKRILKMYR